VVGIPDVITYANFGDDWLRGLGVAGGKSLPFSIDFDRRPYNTLALPCECVITFSLSLILMHLYVFIAILVPKLAAIVMPLCPLCTGVSQMNYPIAQTLSQNQTARICCIQLKL